MSSGFSDITNDGSIYANGARNSRYVFPAFTIGQPSLNDYSWSEIQGICKLGLAKEYFNVGDTKTIELGALPNAANATSAQKATLVVGDISSDGTTMTMLVIKYHIKAPTHVMNTTSTNSGGWEATNMRAWLNDEYLNALPSDLQNIIKIHSSSYATYRATSVSYCDDNLWLLSAKEVFGGTIQEEAGEDTTYKENLYAFNAETQLAYFAMGNNKVYDSWYWLRSSTYNETVCFLNIWGSGVIHTNGADNKEIRAYPAFDIG
jgi:hypothetical protein